MLQTLRFLFIVLFILTSFTHPQKNKLKIDSSKSLPILTLESLSNAQYRVGNYLNLIKLYDGAYVYPMGEQYSDRDFYIIFDRQTYCKLDGDDLLDAIVILWEKFGGNEYWPYIIPVLNKNGVPYPLKSFPLPDRTEIKRIYKKSSVIYLELVVHDKDDPACCPSKNETWKLKFEKNEFIKID